MTALPDTYMPLKPLEYRVTILDTPEDLHLFTRNYGHLLDADGNVTLSDGDREAAVPPDGLYWLQLVKDGVPAEGLVRLLTKEQFDAGFTEFEAPYFEYGVKYLPRRNDVVEYGSLENAKAALAEAPSLRASGNYAIARRLIVEPGPWEVLPDVDFAETEIAA